jgi:hypothetical protein
VKYSSGIYCDIGGPSCIASITTIGWDMQQSLLEINFDTDTNEPEFTTEGFGGMLELTPMPSFLSTPPKWQTPRKLTLNIDLPQDHNMMSDAFNQGKVVVKLPSLEDRLKVTNLPMRGKLRMRLGDVGRNLKLKLWHNDQVIAQTQSFQVQDCDNSGNEVYISENIFSPPPFAF